jgi:hypothetical protein
VGGGVTVEVGIAVAVGSRVEVGTGVTVTVGATVAAGLVGARVAVAAGRTRTKGHRQNDQQRDSGQRAIQAVIHYFPPRAFGNWTNSTQSEKRQKKISRQSPSF